MSDLFEESEDATPLTPEEKQELLPAHITYRSELNEAEQENIVRAEEWAFARPRDLLTEKFIKDLHKRMLGEVPAPLLPIASEAKRYLIATRASPLLRG